jgi:alpha-glucosidase
MTNRVDAGGGQAGSRRWTDEPVVYEVYVRSFADSSGDGVGDLEGIRRGLWHLDKLGVDALWVTPFYLSPQLDAGYDITDHCAVDPLFGSDDDARRLIETAHAHGLRLLVDIVPNHTSAAHAWFTALLAGDEAMAARYHVLAGRGRGGEDPPNDWVSLFGGSAWTRLPDGRWYLHLFDSSQPDLNWRNPAVRQEFRRIFQTWIDRGVDGFRIDVAAAMVKAADYPDYDYRRPLPTFDRPETHDIHREWHTVFSAADRELLSVGEVFGAPTTQALLDYARSDELTSIFAFPWLHCAFEAGALRAVAEDWLRTAADVGSLPSWLLGSHDFPRPVTRYGGGRAGSARARAMALVTLALPGAAYIHQGEELGLPEVDLPPEARQDPTYFRTQGASLGRDGVRVPLPWQREGSAFGFADEGVRPWLPQPPSWRELAIDAQWHNPQSSARLYRDAIALRRRLLLPAGREIEWLDWGEGVLAFRRGGVLVVLNTSAAEISLPGGVEVLRSSGGPDPGRLPPDCAVWLLVPR